MDDHIKLDHKGLLTVRAKQMVGGPEEGRSGIDKQHL